MVCVLYVQQLCMSVWATLKSLRRAARVCRGALPKLAAAPAAARWDVVDEGWGKDWGREWKMKAAGMLKAAVCDVRAVSLLVFGKGRVSWGVSLLLPEVELFVSMTAQQQPSLEAQHVSVAFSYKNVCHHTGPCRCAGMCATLSVGLCHTHVCVPNKHHVLLAPVRN